MNYDSVGDNNYNNRDDNEVLIVTMMTMMVKTILISVATSSKFFYPVIKPPFRLADISHLKGFFLSPGMKINFQKGI